MTNSLIDSSTVGNHAFREESSCNQAFEQLLPVWHLYTPGNLSEIIFTDDEEFKFGMNLTALCCSRFPSLRILTFQLMSNHIHFIISGDKDEIIKWFSLFKSKLRRYLHAIGRSDVDLCNFSPSLKAVEDINYLRTSIVYVNRNGYVVHPDETPFSYKWGANRMYFNEDAKLRADEIYKNLGNRNKRKMFRSHDVYCPGEYKLTESAITPASYCFVDEGEKTFRNAHQYFALISRGIESYGPIARELADKVFYTDDELYQLLTRLSMSQYDCPPKLLNKEAKIKIARQLHFDYNATDKQIMRMLKLDEYIVRSLFPGSN